MTPVARLTLVSHAQTAALRAARFGADEPLDEQGAERAAAAAGTLRPGQRVVHGHTLRTRQTGEALGLSAVADSGLRDLDVGAWRGQRLQDLAPHDVQAWLTEPSVAPHGGESILELIDRVRGWLDDAGREPGRVVAVTHPAVVRAALVAALSAAPESFWRIDVPPLSTSVLHGRAGAWTLRHACLPLLPSLRA